MHKGILWERGSRQKNQMMETFTETALTRGIWKNKCSSGMQLFAALLKISILQTMQLFAAFLKIKNAAFCSLSFFLKKLEWHAPFG